MTPKFGSGLEFGDNYPINTDSGATATLVDVRSGREAVRLTGMEATTHNSSFEVTYSVGSNQTGTPAVTSFAAWIGVFWLPDSDPRTRMNIYYEKVDPPAGTTAGVEMVSFEFITSLKSG